MPHLTRPYGVGKRSMTSMLTKWSLALSNVSTRNRPAGPAPTTAKRSGKAVLLIFHCLQTSTDYTNSDNRHRCNPTVPTTVATRGSRCHELSGELWILEPRRDDVFPDLHIDHAVDLEIESRRADKSRVRAAVVIAVTLLGRDVHLSDDERCP